MTSVSSSRLPTGSRTERSTTSLIASRFRERRDPFWSCGRSTNTSRVVVRLTYQFGRLDLDGDRMVVLLLDLLRRVLDFLGEGREVRLAQVLHDALDDRDDHVADDLHRLVEGQLVREPVQGVVLHDDHTVRFSPEILESLPGGLRAALHLEGQDRNPDGHRAVRAGGPRDDRRRARPRAAAEARDDEDDVR